MRPDAEFGPLQPTPRATMIWLVLTVVGCVLAAQWLMLAGFTGFIALNFAGGFVWGFARAVLRDWRK